MPKLHQSSLMAASEQGPIDIVVLWVDGNDPTWQQEKAKYQLGKTTDANAVNRFRDWGLMKYWFRAIEAFAPWVRTIHFVTWGHTPEFLNLDHPRLHLVRHEDYLPHDCLPTFNASAIEMSIHKIEGLAENFIYFNDDIFLLRPVKQERFFRDGLPVLNGSENLVSPVGKLLVWHALYYGDLGIINKHFDKRKVVKLHRRKYRNRVYGFKSNLKTLALEHLFRNRFVGFAFTHAAAPFRKQAFAQVWEAEPELLLATTAQKYRNYSDLNQWVVQWWQIASGEFSPGTVDNLCFSAEDRLVDTICKAIRNQAHDMICINDPDNPTDFEAASKKLQDAFEAILPKKCAFEK